MAVNIESENLIALGLEHARSESMARRVNQLLTSLPPAEAWSAITTEILAPNVPFEIHKFLYDAVFSDWDARQGPPPAWRPSEGFIETTNIAGLMRELNLDNYAQLHHWSVQHRDTFWETVVRRLGIRFETHCEQVLDLSSGVESPRWFPDARLNIADSCFVAPADATAIVHQPEGGRLSRMTYHQLESLTHRVANGLVRAGYGKKDAVAVCMPMTAECVALYLGLIRAGCVVVSIADSFAADEIGRRVRIAHAKLIFTQDCIHRAGRKLPSYSKIVASGATRTVVLPAAGAIEGKLRDTDCDWETFIGDEDPFESIVCDPRDHTNILFSSGTTGDPKAIPWTHLTPIKCAADAYLHQNIQPGDVIAWPTNLGWMMGPWLIYASLVNRGTIALFDGAPTGGAFGRFIQDAEVTMLGVVPSLVRIWKASGCMEKFDWSRIKAFSSTGECSNTDEMLYLMSLAGYRPIIEYCGGTEIGGGYLTGTTVQPSSPSTFSTPSLGLDLCILGKDGEAVQNGEVFISPPSIGLSTELLNHDHLDVYFEGVPRSPEGFVLRRHGDQIERLGNGYYRAHGRVDDTMNLGGIKVSSGEVERVLNTVEGIEETAAIAVTPASGGPEQLVIFAVVTSGCDDEEKLKQTLQSSVKERLNPLFKIQELVLVDAFPRTASNKVMRRELRARYTVV